MFGESKAKRILELETRLDRLEGRFRSLSVEWEDTYDKLGRMLSRISKSRAVIESHDQGEQEQEAPLSPPATPTGRLLTPAQLAVQQQILRRRAGG